VKLVVQRFLNAITFLTVTAELLLIARAISIERASDLYEIIAALTLIGHGFVVFANYVFYGKLTLWHRFETRE
jgi:hypothetical protein